MKDRLQQGFTLVEGLLIAIALLLVAGSGYYVYTQRTHKDEPTAATPASNTEQSKSDSAATQSPAKKYLKIPEAGVQFELTDALDGAYYKVSKEGYIYFSLHYFDNLKGFDDCRADPSNSELGFAALEYAKVGDDHFGSPWTKAELEGFSNVKIGDTYYWITGNQAACWDMNTIPDTDPGVKKAEQTRGAFTGQSGTIKKL